MMYNNLFLNILNTCTERYYIIFNNYIKLFTNVNSKKKLYFVLIFYQII